MYEFHMSKVNKKANEENIANVQYLRDYYLKDFKYISPNINNIDKIGQGKGPQLFSVGGSGCKRLFRKWLTKVMDGLKQFLYGGSLHGVKYIFEPTFSRKERVTWIIIVIISIAICTGVIIQLFLKSSSIPFVNVIDSLPTPVWAVPFPTIVLCPHLHVQLSYRNISELDKLDKFFASRICPQMATGDFSLEERMSPEENKMLMEFIVEGSPKCKDIVKTCNWRGTNQSRRWMSTECCDFFFTPLFTNYGLCFTFNGLPLNGMTNITIPWQETFTNLSQAQSSLDKLEWSLDGGYPKVFPPKSDKLPYRAMGSGETNGLGLELFLNTSEHQFACDGDSLGFNVLIDSPSDHFYTSTVLRLPMDRMTTIEIYPITYKTDSTLRTLNPDRRQCFFQNERKLVYYEFYTGSNCKHDLLIREAVKNCSCVHFHWPRKDIEEPICATKSDFNCIDKVKAKVDEMLIYAYFDDSEEQRRPKSFSDSCHPSCNDILYSSQVFYSDLIKEPGDASPEWGSHENREVTRVNIHFYDDMFLGQHRHMQYDDYYFVGAIGGLLSLFLGFSIISVAELVYFVILRPFHLVLKEQFIRP